MTGQTGVMEFCMSSHILLLLAITATFLPGITTAAADDLQTVAERSDYTQTATYDDVIDLLDRIDAQSNVTHRTTMGRTVDGRDIPLLIIADPPIESADQAHATGRPIVFAFGNIHAGEVCGKEALLMLARELATTPNHPLLDELIIVIAPIYNADGNERFAPVEENRPGQIGPERVGIRANAQGLDLNRDYIKLEAPETRALVLFLNTWDPLLTIDTHTTNGSQHRYTLTYDTPLHPSTPREIVKLLRDQLLPTVTQRVKDATGYDMFYYGNFNGAHTKWATYSWQPRFGGNYHGLRGQMQILSEAYSYAPYRDRVLCTLAFCRAIMEYAAEHAGDIVAVHDRARQRTIEAGRNRQPDDLVVLDARFAAFHDPAVIKGFALETSEDGATGITAEPADHRVVHVGRFEATRAVPRPFAYIIEPGCAAVIENLRAHGIEVQPFEGDARVESIVVTGIDRAERAFQGHRVEQIETRTEPAVRTFDSGSYIVRTAQPLGTLAVFLLEPESADGLFAWNFFDEHVEIGKVLPVCRVRSGGTLE